MAGVFFFTLFPALLTAFFLAVAGLAFLAGTFLAGAFFAAALAAGFLASSFLAGFLSVLVSLACAFTCSTFSTKAWAFFLVFAKVVETPCFS
ncbi:MAG TPA: hypothetical protein DCY86_11880 [Bdellovibrionales bacterium]|nr:hypothetical protein [Bdellovibrionales bacterium]